MKIFTAIMYALLALVDGAVSISDLSRGDTLGGALFGLCAISFVVCSVLWGDHGPRGLTHGC